jgi:hypothetical protein
MLLWLLACDRDPPLARVPPTIPTSPCPDVGPTVTSSAGPTLDLPSLHLSVDRLAPITTTNAALHVSSAPEGAEVQLWLGHVGGTTCPSELAGCLDLAEPVLLGSVVADSAGEAEFPWDVGAEEGEYPVFQAAIAYPFARSQVVMRGVYASWPPPPPYPPDGFQGLEDLVLAPGDYHDLTGPVHASVPVRGGTHIEARIAVDGPFDGEGPYFTSTDPHTTPSVTALTWTADVRNTSQLLIDVANEYWDDPGPYSIHIETMPGSAHDWTLDQDQDGFGGDCVATAALAPEGYVWRDGDCDDADPATSPDAIDVCEDGVDQDCSGDDRSCHVTLGGRQKIDAVAFAKIVATDVQQLASGGDRDQDGLDDLVVTGSNTASLWGEPLVGAAEVPDAELTGLCCWGRMDADSPGDVDGDGYDDLLIADTTAHGGDGAVYLVTAPLVGAQPVDVVARTTIRGPAGQALGAVGRVGDADGDGVHDVLVGSERAGSAYLFLTVPAGTVEVEAADAVLRASGLGRDVAGADLDGDGVAELIASATDGVWVVGGATGIVDLEATGTAIVGGTGWSLAVGDVDGDGHVDLGARADSASAVTIALGPLSSGASFGDVVVEEAYVIAIPGDLDGDGASELATGNWTTALDGGPARDGGAVAVFASPVQPGVHALTDGDAVWEGSAVGLAVAGPGDLDGDGLADLAVGGPQGVWLVHGAAF